MKPAMLAVGLLAGFLNGSTAVSSDTVYPATTTVVISSPLNAPIATSTGEQSSTAIKTRLRAISEATGVSYDTMYAVIDCESGFNPNAVGDSGHSFGLVQIYLDYHPTVTKSQALDPDFAIEFLADKLSKNQGYLWTCYRSLKLKT